ncbi:sensor histidine kinase KdpD, partial [Streptomyces sp. 2MCAF27]
GTAARHTHQAVRATSEARALSRMAAAMMRGEPLPTLVEQVRENFSLTAVSLLERDTGHGPEPRWYVVASTGVRPPERPYDADVEAPIDDRLTLAARGRGLSGDDRRILTACAAQIGVAHTRGGLARRGAGTELDEQVRPRAGALYLRPVDLDEALTAALDDLGPGGHSISLRLPERLPDVIADAALLARVLA